MKWYVLMNPFAGRNGDTDVQNVLVDTLGVGKGGMD